MRGWKIWPALLMLGLLLSGCNGAIFRPGSEWPQVGEDFVKRLRWQDLSGAAAHFADEQRGAFLERSTELAELQMVDGQLETFILTENDRRAESVAVLQYYRFPSASVRRWVLRQQWEYRGAGHLTPGQWRIVSPLPPLSE